MKKIFYLSFVALLLLTSCDERFMTWKEHNEVWLEERKTLLGKEDSEVIETRVLDSGVLIEIYHTGYGPVPKPSVDPSTSSSSLVKVNYKGWLIDGTEFDGRDNAAFSLSGVINGWQDAMSQMPQGSHWRIYVPASRGYDEKGSSNAQGNFSVPPHSTLIFDIDLIDVQNF